MSKHDFTPAEFAGRLSSLRSSMDAAKLDWLLVTHPVSIRWLIGQDTKSYTVFQALAVSAQRMVMFTRGTERAEFEADTMASEFRFYGGGEPEDPMQAFAAFADTLGLRNGHVGLEVPGAYMQPGHHVAVKSLLGEALVQDGAGLVSALRAVK